MAKKCIQSNISVASGSAGRIRCTDCIPETYYYTKIGSSFFTVPYNNVAIDFYLIDDGVVPMSIMAPKSGMAIIEFVGDALYYNEEVGTDNKWIYYSIFKNGVEITNTRKLTSARPLEQLSASTEALPLQLFLGDVIEVKAALRSPQLCFKILNHNMRIIYL